MPDADGAPALPHPHTPILPHSHTPTPPHVLVLATRNAGKLREIRALLASLPVEVRSLADYPQVGEVAETGSTFEANAELKARAVAEATGELALADDSGLVVDALDGAPGVLSARFGGPGATDADRNTKLLALLREVPAARRAARFVAAVALAGPGGRVQTVAAACEGRIAFEPRGSQGFGYDPIFLIAGREQTMAEIPQEEKNTLSHRGQAVAKARDLLAEWLGAAG